LENFERGDAVLNDALDSSNVGGVAVGVGKLREMHGSSAKRIVCLGRGLTSHHALRCGGTHYTPRSKESPAEIEQAVIVYLVGLYLWSFILGRFGGIGHLITCDFEGVEMGAQKILERFQRFRVDSGITGLLKVLQH
jgi:hypothetical protein